MFAQTVYDPSAYSLVFAEQLFFLHPHKMLSTPVKLPLVVNDPITLTLIRIPTYSQDKSRQADKKCALICEVTQCSTFTAGVMLR